jgi:2,4-dienoyl-CoA reductase-like NADH-dependent reductase (Old Yellow Enzyme family)
MPEHNLQRFNFRCLDELRRELDSRNLPLPLSDNLSILARPASMGRLTAPNRLVCQPMEGCDSEPDGSPGELTLRRYRRFGAGGAGVIWFEATAVAHQGRANPRQLWLHEANAPAFAHMLAQCRAAADDAGQPQPICVLQLTHSGRYSRPDGPPEPVIAHRSAVLDPCHNLPPDYPLITDDQLDALGQDFVRAALLAAEAGFDAVDVKACHRYLFSELLAGFTREHGRYGGSFENRIRMLSETVAAIRAAAGDRLEVTTRVNLYDAIDWPWGWGSDPDRPGQPKLDEPIELLRRLGAQGLAAANITIGNPYFNPHINRPHDAALAGAPLPPEDPIVGQSRIVSLAGQTQQAVGSLPIVGSGYSWLRHLAPHAMAGAIAEGQATFAGLGRGAFACPDFARRILTEGRLDPSYVCIACSRCSQIMRDGGQAGCVVRDAEVYGPIYRQGRAKAEA